MKAKFIDRGHTLYHFADRIYVQCPGERGPGVIQGKADYHFLQSARLTALQGTFHKSWDGRTWFGPVFARLNHFCPHCGLTFQAPVIEREKIDAHLPAQFDHACESCGKRSQIPLTWFRGDISQPGLDPFFGLPLLLRGMVKDHVMWFFNRAHLDYVRDYVKADLRERIQPGKWSMITRLPGWVKEGKNRDRILRVMQRIEGQLDDLERT